MIYVVFYERTASVLRACKGTTELRDALDAAEHYAALHGYAEIEMREGTTVRTTIYRNGTRRTTPPLTTAPELLTVLPPDPNIAPIIDLPGGLTAA